MRRRAVGYGSTLLEAAAMSALARLICFIGERAEALGLAREAIGILRKSEAGMTFRGASDDALITPATGSTLTGYP